MSSSWEPLALLHGVISSVTSHAYISSAVLILIHVAVYLLLRSKPPLLLKSKDLKISAIYVYPIKSIRGTEVSQVLASAKGFEHDRQFMLLQKTSDGYKNMAVARYPIMTRFITSFDSPVDNKAIVSFTVEFKSDQTNVATISIPLQPATDQLEPMDVVLHGSPTQAFVMPTKYSAWFSSCFGYEVLLVYLGHNSRDVLFSGLQPRKHGFVMTKLTRTFPKLNSVLPQGYRITFADCAPYLIVSKTSLTDVSSRLPQGEVMDVTKFRPNIVVEGPETAWEEDFWAELEIKGAKMLLAQNCVRCVSINIDYETGKPGVGESGQVLKKLQKDRRVDEGMKHSPVFGRYSFWSAQTAPRILAVGDKVKITRHNATRTRFRWEGALG